MKIEEFKVKLNNTMAEIEFADTMAVIEENYNFTPTAFTNGKLKNKAGENSGSCKLFAFATLQGFTVNETLRCFGKFYSEEVLFNLDGDNHQNIRNFMLTGFDGILFDGEALKTK
ncbi:HopJ type III effector protein [uncultured Maribacter sp.]|uniref:HopJ type III effector protein n=1 Tax=uncultured Maribacter sp. TaxID=431308 RepID=UPI00262C9399|nr:HopJ type III effector protein [uncultured Maribacter sp.]